MRRLALPLLLLTLVTALTGCATAISGPQAAPDGAFVVSVSSSRVFSPAIEPIEEALAEARFKCWSERKALAVLSRQTQPATGPGRTATLRFQCAAT